MGKETGRTGEDTMTFGFPKPQSTSKLKNNILWHMNLMGFDAGVPGTADKSAVFYQSYWVACMMNGVGAE